MSEKQHNNPYSISQNFLTCKKTIRRLISKTTLSPNDTVLEIGAGKGHITKALSETCRVISYEIDENLYSKLKPQLNGNVRLYCRDFLKCALPRAPYKVFANIPFSKTSEIVRKLTLSDNPPEAIWLIMEKGAAKRFMGVPKENVGSLSLKPFFDVRIVWHFDRRDFHPAPNVDAVLLEMKLKKSFDLPYSQRYNFRAFLEHGQGGMLRLRKLLTQKQISTALKLEHLPQIPPSGDLSYVQWLCLFRCRLKFRSETKRNGYRS